MTSELNTTKLDNMHATVNNGASKEELDSVHEDLDNKYDELSNTIMENETIIATKFKKLEDKLNNILIALLFPSLIMNVVIIFILLWIYNHG